MTFYKALRKSLLIFLLSLSLVSCSVLKIFTKEVEVEKIVRVGPPIYLLNDCQIHYLEQDQNTVADILRLSINNTSSLEMCNIDKQALRSWLFTIEELNKQ